MPKITGKTLVQVMNEKIKELESKHDESKNPLIEAHSLSVITALKAMLTPALADSDEYLSQDNLQPFYAFLKQQEDVQFSVASYFINPLSRGNQLCLLLAEQIKDMPISKYTLLLPSVHKIECVKLVALSLPKQTQNDNALKRYILSDDGKHIINVKACLADAAEKKECDLFHRGKPLTENETKRVAGHSSFTEVYYDELKKYAVEAKLEEIEKRKLLLRAKDNELEALFQSDKLELKNTGGDNADKVLVEKIFSTIKAKNDLVDFMLKMSRTKWISFVGAANKYKDLYHLILDNEKNVDSLLANEMQVESTDKVKIYLRQFLAATAYSIERKKEGNVSWSGWLLSFAPTYTGVYTKQPKLDCNVVQMFYLSLPPDVIQKQGLTAYAKNHVKEENWKALFGSHTLGTLSSWISKHSAPDQQELSQVLSGSQVALRLAVNQ